jgi:hypothetical protein
LLLREISAHFGPQVGLVVFGAVTITAVGFLGLRQR